MSSRELVQARPVLARAEAPELAHVDERLESGLSGLLSGWGRGLSIRTVALCASEGPDSPAQVFAELPAEGRPQAALDLEALRRAIVETDPTVLPDRDASTPIRSWIAAPLEVRSPCRPGLAVFLLLGSELSANGLEARLPLDVPERVRELTALFPESWMAPHPLEQDGMTRTILESIPLPVLITDVRERVLLANTNFGFLFGAPAEGAGLEERVPPAKIELFRAAHRSTLHWEGAVELPIGGLAPPLERLDFRMTTALLEAGHGGPGVIFVLREISGGRHG